MATTTEISINERTIDTAASAMQRILRKHQLPYSYSSKIELVKKPPSTSIKEAIEAGCNDPIGKPVEPSSLNPILRHYLGNN